MKISCTIWNRKTQMEIVCFKFPRNIIIFRMFMFLNSIIRATSDNAYVPILGIVTNFPTKYQILVILKFKIMPFCNNCFIHLIRFFELCRSKSNFWPLTQLCLYSRRLNMFQQDSATPFVAFMTQEWLAENFLNLVSSNNWPPCFIETIYTTRCNF